MNRSEYKALKVKEKEWAHSMVATAKKAHDLIPQPCEVCECTENIHAHHDDYKEPLSVRWLCAKHHARHHAAESLPRRNLPIGGIIGGKVIHRKPKQA